MKTSDPTIREPDPDPVNPADDRSIGQAYRCRQPGQSPIVPDPAFLDGKRGKPIIVVDFSRMDIAGGFGQICTNFAPRLAQSHIPWARFIFLVPPGHHGAFGDHIGYHTVSPREKLFPILLPKADLWHATDQDFRYRRHGRHCLQLLTVHDLNFLYEKPPFKQKRYRHRLQSRIDASDYLTAISEFTAGDMRRHIDLKGKDIEIIPNGIEDISGLPGSRPAFDNGQEFFFTIGQVRPKKNFHVLVEMMKKFPQYRLYICGDDRHPYADTVRAEIERCGLQEQVVLTGQISRNEKVWLYRHCTAFLFPSFAEGFGLPVLEAMLFAKPVFASNATSLPEVCGPYAVLWENYRADYLARSLQDGLQSFASRPETGRKEQQYALSFTYERYTERYLNLYARILSGRESRCRQGDGGGDAEPYGRCR